MIKHSTRQHKTTKHDMSTFVYYETREQMQMNGCLAYIKQDVMYYWYVE